MSRPHLKNEKIQEPARKLRSGLFHIVFGRTALILLCLLAQFGILIYALGRAISDLPLFFGGVVAFTAGMLLYILNAPGNPSVKLSWCVIISVLPLFGSVLYFLVRIDLGHRMEQKLIRRTLQESRHYAPKNPELMERLKIEDRQLYNLTRYLGRSGPSRIYENTQVTYFPLGEAMFQQMLEKLRQAERFIFLEYFFISDSFMWNSILDILRQKVQEGVEVRVMYDGSCTITYLPHDYPKTLRELGIRCKVFSPFRPLVSTHYNNRDHRKILVIDNQVAFTGGVNLQDRYINRKQVHGHWKDTGVMVNGEAAQGFTLMFLQMWNATEAEPVYEPYLSVKPRPIYSPGYVLPYGDSPLDNKSVGKRVYLDMINEAKEYVYIMTPYLILDSETENALQFAAMRGVDVRILLPHIPDKRTAFALAKSHYGALLEHRVKLYEYTPGFIHAKALLCDDREAVVGTINLDYRSLFLHFECAAYLYRVPAIHDIRRDFQETLARSQAVTREEVRKRNIFVRIGTCILKLFAPLM